MQVAEVCTGNVLEQAEIPGQFGSGGASREVFTRLKGTYAVPALASRLTTEGSRRS